MFLLLLLLFLFGLLLCYYVMLVSIMEIWNLTKSTNTFQLIFCSFSSSSFLFKYVLNVKARIALYHSLNHLCIIFFAIFFYYFFIIFVNFYLYCLNDNLIVLILSVVLFVARAIRMERREFLSKRMCEWLSVFFCLLMNLFMFVCVVYICEKLIRWNDRKKII